MGTRIKIDGVGIVEVGDNFTQLSPQEQQHTVEEIAASAKSRGAATAPQPAAPAPTQGNAPAAPTYQPLERAITRNFPGVRVTSDYRTPEHNAEVGGVANSMHVRNGGDAVDMVGGEADTPQGRERIKQFLATQGVQPDEFLYHNVGSGNHLHVGASSVPNQFRIDNGQNPHPLDSEAFKAEFSKRVLSGASDDELRAFANANNRDVVQESLDKFRAAEKGRKPTAVNVDDRKAAAAPEQPSQPGGLRHDLDYYGDQIRRGVGDIIDAPANIADMEFKGGRAIGRWLTGGPLMGDNGSLNLPDWARPGEQLNAAQDEAEKKDLGYLPEAANAPQRYAGAALRTLTSAAVPATKLAAAGKARAALAALTGGVGAGVGGQAGQDVAPTLGVDPDKAAFVGSAIGGIAAGAPVAAKPIQEARFIKARVNDPRVPFAAHAVDKAEALSDATGPNGVFPKGRGPLSVEQINSVGKEFLNKISPRLHNMDLPAEEKARLQEAILRKSDLKPEEIDALEGTTTGDAVAEGIRMFQATRALTPAYNGAQPAAWRRFAALGTNLALGIKTGGLSAVAAPVINKFIRGSTTDLNMSRLDAMNKALGKRRGAWAKLGEATGSDQVGSKTDKFVQEHDAKLALDQQAQELQAKAVTRQKAAVAQQKAAKAGEKNDADLFKSTFPNRPKDSSNRAAAVAATPVTPSSSVTKAQSALKKLETGAQVGSTAKAIDKLNAPPKPAAAPKPKARPAADLAAENNIAQGIHGNYNAYADSLNVKRSDVLAALRQIKTDDIDPFEIQKLVHGYKLSNAGRTALIPRLQKQLKDSGVTEFRAKEAAAASAPPPKPEPKSAAPTGKAKKAPAPKADAPAEAPAATTNFDQEAPPPQSERGDYRPIVRKAEFAQGKANYQAAFDKGWHDLSKPDSPHPQEIVAAAHDGLEHIRNREKTTEAAMRYFDDHLGPQLRKDFTPHEIADLRQDVERMAHDGKPYKTDAEFEKGAKRGPRGRPRKQTEAHDDVPF